MKSTIGTLGLVILLVILVILVVYKTTESFTPRPSNVFMVEDTLPKTNKKKKIIEGVTVPFQKSDLYEVSKETFEHRDLLLSILKNHITGATIFKDSLSSIFTGLGLPTAKAPAEVVFDIIIYDSKDFFAQKIRVYINDFLGENPQVTLSEISDTEVTAEGPLPNRSELEPSYYRILNTLHLSAPFKTTVDYNKTTKK